MMSETDIGNCSSKDRERQADDSSPAALGGLVTSRRGFKERIRAHGSPPATLRSCKISKSNGTSCEKEIGSVLKTSRAASDSDEHAGSCSIGRAWNAAEASPQEGMEVLDLPEPELHAIAVSATFADV